MELHASEVFDLCDSIEVEAPPPTFIPYSIDAPPPVLDDANSKVIPNLSKVYFYSNRNKIR